MTLSDHIGKQRIDIKQHRVFKADFRSVGFKITEFLRIFQNAPSSRHPVFTALPADGIFWIIICSTKPLICNCNEEKISGFVEKNRSFVDSIWI